MSSYDSDKVAAIHRELHDHLPNESALRVKALESLLFEKGMLDSKAVDAWVQLYTEEVGPKRGAHVVAKSWVDPAFRTKLLENATAVDRNKGWPWPDALFLTPWSSFSMSLWALSI